MDDLLIILLDCMRDQGRLTRPGHAPAERVGQGICDCRNGRIDVADVVRLFDRL